MKVKIVSKTFYVAETESGQKFDVDIKNPIIKHAFDNNLEIEGEIHREEKQDRYVNGEYARSYTVRERFIPKKEKITISDGVQQPIGKYEQKFGPEFTKTMKEINDEVNKEEKPKRPRLHLTIPEKESKK